MSKLFRTAVIASLATFAVGCASTAPKPFAALAKAEASIEQAKRADARRFDPANLDQAKQKLTAARADAQKRDSKSLDRSRRLAEQAELDAELASANATAAAADVAAKEVNASIDALRSETNRETNPR